MSKMGKSVVPALSTLAVRLECRFFSLLLIFLFDYGNLLECRMQSAKAAEAARSMWMRALQKHICISHEE